MNKTKGQVLWYLLSWQLKESGSVPSRDECENLTKMWDKMFELDWIRFPNTRMRSRILWWDTVSLSSLIGVGKVGNWYKQWIREDDMPASYQVSFLRIFFFFWRWSTFYIITLKVWELIFWVCIQFFSILNVIFEPFDCKDAPSLDVLRQALHFTSSLVFQFLVHFKMFTIYLINQLSSFCYF